MGQIDVLSAFRAFVAREGRSPLLRELQEELGADAPGLPTISQQLAALAERGALVRHSESGMMRYRLREQPDTMSRESDGR